jgi:hypothetical protein
MFLAYWLFRLLPLSSMFGVRPDHLRTFQRRVRSWRDTNERDSSLRLNAIQRRHRVEISDLNLAAESIRRRNQPVFASMPSGSSALSARCATTIYELRSDDSMRKVRTIVSNRHTVRL